jgi:uncharacterized damage-inducible protein DinB
MMRGMFLGSVENEQKTTAKVIAAIPDQNHGYRPDEKSKTAMELAWHIASVDVWFLESVAGGAFGTEEMKMPAELTTGAAMAGWYNTSFAASAAKVAALGPEALTKVLDFYGVFQMPAVMYLSFCNNHMIHHRGQLSTYLRAMGGKCPSIYGGSADEPFQAAAAS